MTTHLRNPEADVQDVAGNSVEQDSAQANPLEAIDADDQNAQLMAFGARLNNVVSATDLSPENAETLETLEANFNKHELKLKTGLDWSEVAAKLEANPEKITTLKKLIDRGGEPTVTAKLSNGQFRFDELSEESPRAQRNMNWNQAYSYAEGLGGGCHLMEPRVYKTFRHKGIVLDESNPSWLNGDPKFVKREVVACIGENGFAQNINFATFSWPAYGLRCSLEV